MRRTLLEDLCIYLEEQGQAKPGAGRDPGRDKKIVALIDEIRTVARIGASPARLRWQIVDEHQQFVKVTRKQAFQMVYDAKLTVEFHAVHSGGVGEDFSSAVNVSDVAPLCPLSRGKSVRILAPPERRRNDPR